MFWAIRRLMEHVARKRPLVVVIEDIQWAAPAGLDLIEHIADLSRDTPVLLLCPARPDLLDTRPGWGGGKVNATTLLLEPLGTAATDRLIAAMPGGRALPPAVVARVAAAAEGNPLFIEELLGILVDDGFLRESADGSWDAGDDLEGVRIPPSIGALLAARLDSLGPDERAVAERASVVGRIFEQAAVTELATGDLRREVGRSLVALVRKELIRPERSDSAVGEAYKFRHILIRDAAYEAIPKAERARLHEHFADWLEGRSAERSWPRCSHRRLSPGAGASLSGRARGRRAGGRAPSPTERWAVSLRRGGRHSSAATPVPPPPSCDAPSICPAGP